MSIIELAWAAGFYDGEGSTYVKLRKPGRPETPRGHATVHASVKQVERVPIDRFSAAIRIGRVRGPYLPSNPNGRPCYEWGASGTRALAAIEQLRPYLSQPKLDQIDQAIAEATAWHIANPVNAFRERDAVTGRFTQERV